VTAPASSHRAEPRPTEIIDRGEELHFTFDGQPVVGHSGDTFGSALAANGIRAIGSGGRALRPRGMSSADAFDPGARVDVDGEPDVPAAHRLAYDGAEVRSSQLERPAGGVWPEPWATSSQVAADVVVVGAGPAGLAAARAAADAGAEVVVLEADVEVGGRLRWAQDPRSGASDDQLLDELIEAVADRDDIDLRTGALAVEGALDGRVTATVAPFGPGHPEELLVVHAEHVIVATGARERVLPFAGGSLPGVMQATGARRLANLWGVRPGDRAVLVAHAGAESPIGPAGAVGTSGHPHGAHGQTGSAAPRPATVSLPLDALADDLRAVGVELVEQVTIGAARGPLRVTGSDRVETVVRPTGAGWRSTSWSPGPVGASTRSC
jgi:sarcosine oxidase subunit alpha